MNTLEKFLTRLIAFLIYAIQPQTISICRVRLSDRSRKTDSRLSKGFNYELQVRDILLSQP